MLKAISPFSHNVFHSYISLVRQNAVLCGNGLNEDWVILCIWSLKGEIKTIMGTIGKMRHLYLTLQLLVLIFTSHRLRNKF